MEKVKSLRVSSPAFKPQTVERVETIHQTLRDVTTSLRRVDDPHLTDRVNAALAPARNEAIRLMAGQSNVAPVADWRRIKTTAEKLVQIENNLRMVKPTSSVAIKLLKSRRDTLDELVKLME